MDTAAPLPTDLSDLPELPSFRVHLDLDGVPLDGRTFCGLSVHDVEPIGTAVLTPGDPVPIGRTPAGDLAYLLHTDMDTVTLHRSSAAFLARLLSEAVGPEPRGDARRLLRSLLDVAAPLELFPGDSAHAALAHRAAQAKALSEGVSPFGPPFSTDDPPPSS